MNNYIYVNIPAASQRNFEIGMEQLIWGWPKRVNTGAPGAAFERLAHLPNTTYLVFISGLTISPPKPAGWPRTPLGDMTAWRRAHWENFTLARVTTNLFESAEAVWPDGVYPYRVRFERVADFTDVAGSGLDSGALEAIRYSTIQHSQPACGPEPVPADSAASGLAPDAGPDEMGGQIPDRAMGDLENLDGFARRAVRREQVALRRARFGDSVTAVCALCGRELPTAVIRLAHIKRRSQSDGPERLDMRNNMAACTLGCDELVERGILTVRSDGTIAVSDPGLTTDFTKFLFFYHGRRLVGFHPDQEKYLAWHRSSGTSLG